jgi:hypothetical protein
MLLWLIPVGQLRGSLHGLQRLHSAALCDHLPLLQQQLLLSLSLQCPLHLPFTMQLRLPLLQPAH